MAENELTNPTLGGQGAALAERPETDTPSSGAIDAPPSSPTTPDVDDTIDRAFILQMAQVPVIASVIVLINWGAYLLWDYLNPGTTNLAPVVVISAGMLLAAFIDGWAFKVPNWLTLSLVVSGWIVGLFHSFGLAIDSGSGGIGASLMGTFLGFALLFPMLLIGGMGEGDVKMQMGFGAWVGAIFGYQAWKIILLAFCVGAIVGGIFGVIMIILRMQYSQNLKNVREIGKDMQVMMSDGMDAASSRARSRRPSWVRLPYGVPLCVGFLGVLWYYLS